MEESPPGSCSKCYTKVLNPPELLQNMQRLIIWNITPFSFVYVSITINNCNVIRETPPSFTGKKQKKKVE